jgi:serine/threonine protein phosphatase PrpC
MTYPPHKPDLNKEKVRIYSKRGEIRESPIDNKSRIYIRARMQPALDHSRTLGDLISHQIGVMSEPEIKIHEILQNDKFFICGSSALWETLGPDEVIEIVNDHGIKDDDCSSDAIISKMKEVNDGQP